MPDSLPPAPPSVQPHLRARMVPWQRALAWYEEALRLFKRRPGVWIALAFVVLAVELSLHFLPDPWPLLSEVIEPLVACGLVYAAAAADRHAAPRLRYALDAFRAPTPAIAAILLASAVTLLAKLFAAWWIADANLLLTHGQDELSASAWIGVYTIGTLAALPVLFVPLHVLLEPATLGEAFAASWSAFVLNTGPLLVYAALSLVLLGFGVLTHGLGLLLAIPLWTASGYAAWRDIFGVEEPPRID